MSDNVGSAVSPTVLCVAEAEEWPTPEPAQLTGALIGYVRVSTREQLLDRQVRALEEAGCGRIFSDELSGRTAERRS